MRTSRAPARALAATAMATAALVSLAACGGGGGGDDEGDATPTPEPSVATTTASPTPTPSASASTSSSTAPSIAEIEAMLTVKGISGTGDTQMAVLSALKAYLTAENVAFALNDTSYGPLLDRMTAPYALTVRKNISGDVRDKKVLRGPYTVTLGSVRVAGSGRGARALVGVCLDSSKERYVSVAGGADKGGVSPAYYAATYVMMQSSTGWRVQDLTGKGVSSC